jgi:hypothetical protein
MNKFYLLLPILILSYSLTGQIEFEPVLPLPPAPQIIADFDAISSGSVAFSDIDNDNDLDVIITGEHGFQNTARIYINDGIGNYLPIESPFEGVSKSAVAFADIDNDNDQDVLITGLTGTFSNEYPTSKLYLNDGSGNFEEKTGTAIDDVFNGSIAFADIDNDNDQDLLVTGINEALEPVAKLYNNDGNGNYSIVSGTPFVGVGLSAVSFADIDNDNDMDVMITGENNTGENISKLYVNDGNGVFSEVPETPFDGVKYSAIAFADIDNNSSEDLIITGEDSDNQRITKLYANDGNGVFSENLGTSIDDVSRGSVAFSDIDNDNDQDILITGFDVSNQNIAKVYLNDGSGSFSFMPNTPFEGVKNSSIAFADINGDDNSDVLICGKNIFGSKLSNLYVNDGLGNYSFVSGTPFNGVYTSSVAFADVDNDNDQDVLICGANELYHGFSELYLNDGNGNYSALAGTPFVDVYLCSIAFADIDNDNDQDVMITGSDNFGVSRLYTNDGTGNFTLVSGTPFSSVYSSSIAFADIDNDNDQDLLISGFDFTGLDITKLYKNDGLGNFSIVNSTPFDGISNGSLAFADVDNDNDKDVLITGLNQFNQIIAKLYKNNGIGIFFEMSGTPFEGVSSSSIAFADTDNDNDQDVLITGFNGSGQPIANLYINGGGGFYSLDTDTPFEGVSNGSVAFADIENDGDQDVLITGFVDSDQNISKLYINDGSGNFTEDLNTSFQGVGFSAVAFSDIDGDNDQDVLITGYNGKGISKLYRNISIIDGINESTIENQISIYPNPYKGIVTINLGSLSNVSLKVLNLTGQTIYLKENINTPVYQLELNETPGIYIVEISSGQDKKSFKLVKQ